MNFSYCIEDKEMNFWYANGNSVMSGDEFHEFHEIIYIFRADGIFLSEKEKAALLPDMLILIPKENYHNFVFEENGEYTRCRIWFSDILEFEDIVKDCMNEIRVITESGGVFKKLFSELTKICKEEYSDSEKRLLLRSSVLRILFEIKSGIRTFSTPSMEAQSELVQNAVSIINEHYCENIGITEIAARLFVSHSKLSHTFKKELNISVYKYITLKRLLFAQKLIKSGIGASHAAKRCGFCDYSSFYRVYKKHFGTSPRRFMENKLK